MDVQNNTRSAVFPRQSRGDQSRAVTDASQQMNKAFGNTEPGRGKPDFVTALRNLIMQLIKSLGRGGQRPPDDPIVQPVYGTPVVTPPPKEPPGAQPVYGAPIGTPEPPKDEPIFQPVYGTPIADPLPKDEPIFQPVYGAPVADKNSTPAQDK
ncbi:MAG: hypothetical protein R3F02_16215 [Thiolinea sp.]